jgi:hypothetical protein
VIVKRADGALDDLERLGAAVRDGAEVTGGQVEVVAAVEEVAAVYAS